MAKAPKTFPQQVAQWQAKLDATAKTMHNPPHDQTPQALGDPYTTQRGPKYHNDVPNDWRRGAGGSAEGKPNFDHSQARLARVTPRRDMGWTDQAQDGPKPKVKP